MKSSYLVHARCWNSFFSDIILEWFSLTIFQSDIRHFGVFRFIVTRGSIINHCTRLQLSATVYLKYYKQLINTIDYVHYLILIFFILIDLYNFFRFMPARWNETIGTTFDLNFRLFQIRFFLLKAESREIMI